MFYSIAVDPQSQKKFHFKEGDSTSLIEFNRVFEKLFNHTWIVNDKEYNLNELGWKMGYMNRKVSLGICTYKRLSIKRFDRGQVLISKKLLQNNLDKAAEFEDVIRHEIAHAIDVEIRGFSNHDNHWKMIARALGANDNRVHEGFLKQPKGKYTATCPNCKKEYQQHRKRKRITACKSCCIKYAYGRFDDRFALVVTQNY